MLVPDQLTRSAAALALGLLGAACHSLQPVPVSFIHSASPQVVYLSDGNGVTQAVANPRLSGDSVVGTALSGNGPVAVPLREVQRITTVRVSRGKTVLLISAFAGAGAMVAYAVLSKANGDDDGFCDFDQQPTGPGATECGYPSNP